MMYRARTALRPGSFFLACLLVGSSPPPRCGAEVPSDRITADVVCKPGIATVPVLAANNSSPATRRMAERLRMILESTRPEAMAFLSDRLADLVERRLMIATNLQERFHFHLQLAIQQTQAGRPDLALNTLRDAQELVEASGGKLTPKAEMELRMRQGVAWLRLGEQENCVFSHNASSCLLPFQPEGVHRLQRGSREAASLFRKQLKDFPNDLTARWLLNLTLMTLGDYPQAVPANLLIPPHVFESEYAMPGMPDVSTPLGLDIDDLAGGVIVDDFDNDGHLDVVASSWDLKGQIRLFRNKGDGSFVERTSEAGLVGETGSLNIQQTDYNNDGWLDIWMLRGGWLGKPGRIPNSLLRNNGDGTFADVTEEAGLLSHHPTQTSRWFDFDGDGWLDVFIGNESVDASDPDPCELYRNNRDGTFTECAAASGIRVSQFIKGVACADYDNDGRPDLYLSSRTGPNILFRNDGRQSSGQWKFSDVTAAAGPVTHPIHSFGTFFFDYDNNGWEDLVVFGYFLPKGVAEVAAEYLQLPTQGTKMKLFKNNKDGTFSDVTQASSLDRIAHTMGHNYGDLDNDGWLDFYCATGDPDFMTLIPNRMFRNNRGMGFQDVTAATRTGHLQKGHGAAFADLDNDGDQDVYVSMGGAYTGDIARNALFLNPGGTNKWLRLKLVGTRANRAAIGSRIKVTLTTPAGPRELHRTISGGGSFGSNPLRQEIGLGDAVAIQSVEIRWAGSGHRQVVRSLELNRSYEILEEDPLARSVPVSPVRLKLPSERPALGEPVKPST